MTLKQSQIMLAPQLEDGLSLKVTEPATNVTVSDQVVMPRRISLTLTDFVLTCTAALDYIGGKICDLPDTNIMILGAELNLEATKGLTTNGIVTTTDINIGVGTAIASNATLSSTMQDVLNVAAYTATDATPALAQHSNDNSALLVRGLDAAGAALYLNLAATITADDTLTCTGTIDIFYMDVGNVTS